MLTDFTMAGNRLIKSNLPHICEKAPSTYGLTETTVCTRVICHMPITILFFTVQLHAGKK